MFFGENIVGSDFNFFGPRIVTLGRYFRLVGSSDPVRFEPLLNKDTTRNLDRLSNISVFTVRVTPSFAETVRDLNADFSSAIEAWA